MFYVKENGNNLEVWEDPNDWNGGKIEHQRLFTVVFDVPAYKPKVNDTICRRWNLLVENRMREIEEVNRKTGEVEHYLVAKK